MQNQRIQENSKPEKYQLERERLYVSILYNNLINKYLQDFDKEKIFIEFSQTLWKASPDSLIGKTFRNDFTD